MGIKVNIQPVSVHAMSHVFHRIDNAVNHKLRSDGVEVESGSNGVIGAGDGSGIGKGMAAGAAGAETDYRSQTRRKDTGGFGGDIGRGNSRYESSYGRG